MDLYHYFKFIVLTIQWCSSWFVGAITSLMVSLFPSAVNISLRGASKFHPWYLAKQNLWKECKKGFQQSDRWPQNVNVVNVTRTSQALCSLLCPKTLPADYSSLLSALQTPPALTYFKT